MSQITTLPALNIENATAPRSKREREHQAFRRLLPQLLATRRGKYVAFHEERLVDSGDDRLKLALRVLARVGSVDIHVGLVSEEPEPISRSGVRREVRPDGDAP